MGVTPEHTHEQHKRGGDASLTPRGAVHIGMSLARASSGDVSLTPHSTIDVGMNVDVGVSGGDANHRHGKSPPRTSNVNADRSAAEALDGRARQR